MGNSIDNMEHIDDEDRKDRQLVLRVVPMPALAGVPSPLPMK